MKLSEQELAELRERISNEPLEPGGNSHVTARLDDSRPDRWIFREGIAGNTVGFIMLTFGTIIIFTGIWSGVVLVHVWRIFADNGNVEYIVMFLSGNI